MMYKLGLKPPRPGSIKMRFGSYFTAAELPAVPIAFGRPWLIRNWGMLGNDKEGDCVWAGAAHETMMLCADANAPLDIHIGPPPNVPMFTSRTCFADYHAVAGPHDDGTDLQEAAAYRQKTGIVDVLGNRHTIDIYTDLEPGNLKEIDLAVYLLGVAGIGVKLPDTAGWQFNHVEPFSVTPGADILGGHYIPIIGRNSHGNYLGVTWGRLTAIDPEWIEEYMDQGIAMVSRERLSQKGLSPQGYNLAQLEDDFKQLTGA